MDQPNRRQKRKPAQRIHRPQDEPMPQVVAGPSPTGPEQLDEIEQAQQPAPQSDAPSEIQNVQNGTFIHQVTDLNLAICLLSVGVPLREDPPFTHVRLTNGQDKYCFNFESATTDGADLTADLIDAYKRDMEWIQDNPTHPMTFAMCALKNRQRIIDVMRKSKPYVGFKAPGSAAVILVVEGSRKYNNCKKKGMIQVDPFAENKK